MKPARNGPVIGPRCHTELSVALEAVDGTARGGVGLPGQERGDGLDRFEDHVLRGRAVGDGEGYGYGYGDGDGYGYGDGIPALQFRLVRIRHRLAAQQDDLDRVEQDEEVDPERHVLDVVQVVPHLLRLFLQVVRV